MRRIAAITATVIPTAIAPPREEVALSTRRFAILRASFHCHRAGGHLIPLIAFQLPLGRGDVDDGMSSSALTHCIGRALAFLKLVCKTKFRSPRFLPSPPPKPLWVSQARHSMNRAAPRGAALFIVPIRT